MVHALFLPSLLFNLLPSYSIGENNNANLESNNFHAAPITALCLSHDGNTVYSADANGVIIISEYENAAAHTAATLAQKTLKQREGKRTFIHAIGSLAFESAMLRPACDYCCAVVASRNNAISYTSG